VSSNILPTANHDWLNFVINVKPTSPVSTNSPHAKMYNQSLVAIEAKVKKTQLSRAQSNANQQWNQLH